MKGSVIKNLNVLSFIALWLLNLLFILMYGADTYSVYSNPGAYPLGAEGLPFWYKSQLIYIISNLIHLVIISVFLVGSLVIKSRSTSIILLMIMPAMIFIQALDTIYFS